MKTFAALAALLIVPAAHAVVGTTARKDVPVANASASGMGQMNGASAVAIGPHLVLTAGHVGMGSFSMDGVAYTATSTEMAPKVSKRATDLRLVRVAETLPGWADLATSVKKGASVTMVGYGSSGVVREDGKGYALTGRAGETTGVNKISSKGTEKSVGPTLRAMIRRAGDAALTAGDSGGGWFVDGKLVGISAFIYSTSSKKTAYGFSKNPYFGSGAIDLTNGTIRKWLNGEIAGDSSGAFAHAAGVQPVPEPAALASLGLGALLVIRRRRRI